MLAARGGRLGFNLKILIETGEESGSPGLSEFCARYADDLAADLLIASDGPRVAAGRPTVFLGSRGAAGFTLRVSLRDRSYHPGNWAGLLRNPATVIACALASLVNGQGEILAPGACARRPSRTACGGRCAPSRFALASLERTEGITPALLPNLGGSLPNDVFTDGLRLPTIWIPHSYPGCAQHAPDEHLLAPLARQALRLMTALFWDLGEVPSL